MRAIALLLSLALVSACATGRPAPGTREFVTRIGVITGREPVDPGESGQLIAFGMLMSSGFSVASQSGAVRYRVKLLNGEEVTVFQDSDQFEVGDCVEISALAGADENPPLMKRIVGGCQPATGP